MAYNPFVGMIFLITSLLGICMGIVLSRIVAEFVLIVFRINEHLGAIRNQGAAAFGAGFGDNNATRTELFVAHSERPLRCKPEMHDVAVLHDVVLAFEPQLAGIARAGLAAAGDIVVIGDGFGADEAAFEIAVNDAGGLRRLACRA